MTDLALLHGKSNALTGAASDVQWMPPGKHKITPTGEDGKQVEMEVTVDESVAIAMEKGRAAYQAAADAGHGDAPYFDLNHEDGPAAAWVKEFFWGGDDPINGGVRAKVDWSDVGRASVEGKQFRRFSPSFYVSRDGRVAGAPVNMGGLVNRAAFKTIQAFFAKDNSAETDPTKNESMNSPKEIDAMMKENEALKEQVTTLTARVQELEAQIGERTAKDAEETVEMAAREGRIPPADESKQIWIAKAKADLPGVKSMLASLPVNPALAAVIKASAAKPNVQREPGLVGLANIIKIERNRA
jgi:phage I-like protein